MMNKKLAVILCLIVLILSLPQAILAKDTSQMLSKPTEGIESVDPNHEQVKL